MSASSVARLLQQANALLDQGALPQARVVFSSVLEQAPSTAEAWLMLGAIDAAMGNLATALSHTRRALQEDPGYEEAHLTLAGLQQNSGELSEALQSCGRALAIDSDYEEAWLMQSGIQGALGQYVASEESSRQVIRLWPECVDAHVNLGNALKAQRQWDAAVAGYREALQLDPDQLHAKINLGQVLLELDRLSDAESCFTQALASNPSSADASLGLARVHLARNDPQPAVARCRDAISSEPGNIAAHLLLCNSLILSAQLEEAAIACSAIPARSSEELCSVAVMHARILERQGEYQQAFEYLQDALPKYPYAPDLVLVFADISRHLKRTEEATALLEQQLGGNLALGVRKQLHFSLGRTYDASQRYDEAFTQFQQANDLKPAVFDRPGHTAAIDSLINAFTAETLVGFSATGSDSQRPVFIVGMPRAGTTLVEQILSCHSAVFGAGELPYIGQMAVSLSGRFKTALPYPACVSSLPDSVFTTLAEEYLARLEEKSQTAICVTDKQNGNYLHLGLIQLLFPRARIIHCVRTPLDTCLSLYTHDMGGEATYTRSFEDLACYYRNYQKLMGHWQRVLTVPMLEIAYEDLVLDQQHKTRELVDFCDLEWEPQCLDFHQNRRAVATPSHAQVRQPLYKSAVHRWKNYQRQLSPLQHLLQG